MDKKLENLKSQQEQLFVLMAGILGGVSSLVRLKLMHFLSQGPLNVETLALKTNVSIANTSMHLRKMLSLRLVSVSVSGKSRIYSLHPAALDFWESCQSFVQNLDPRAQLAVEDVYGEINWKENLKTTIQMLKKKEIILLDARPADEVHESLKDLNVLCIPSSEISKNLSKISKKKPVLVFCRGRFCALSAFVVNELRKNGVKAFRLSESWYAISEAA